MMSGQRFAYMEYCPDPAIDLQVAIGDMSNALWLGWYRDSLAPSESLLDLRSTHLSPH
jgi:hypothetical protein